MRFAFALRLVSALVLVLLAAPVAWAGEVEKRVPFVLGEWIELGASDGPVTLHRIRIERQTGITKSKLMRPGNAQYLTDVQVQLEFTNEATRDWEARVDLEWLDADGQAIDGYDDGENLDSESRHDLQTVTLSTLRYGLARAKTLALRIEFHPE